MRKNVGIIARLMSVVTFSSTTSTLRIYVDMRITRSANSSMSSPLRPEWSKPMWNTSPKTQSFLRIIKKMGLVIENYSLLIPSWRWHISLSWFVTDPSSQWFRQVFWWFGATRGENNCETQKRMLTSATAFFIISTPESDDGKPLNVESQRIGLSILIVNAVVFHCRIGWRSHGILIFNGFVMALIIVKTHSESTRKTRSAKSPKCTKTKRWIFSSKLSSSIILDPLPYYPFHPPWRIHGGIHHRLHLWPSSPWHWLTEANSLQGEQNGMSLKIKRQIKNMKLSVVNRWIIPSRW